MCQKQHNMTPNNKCLIGVNKSYLKMPDIQQQIINTNRSRAGLDLKWEWHLKLVQPYYILKFLKLQNYLEILCIQHTFSLKSESLTNDDI